MSSEPNMDLYYSNVYTPEKCKGYILFVHGGPGNHSAYFEYAVTHQKIYNELPYGWVFYDQRGCGRTKYAENISHQNNISDLGRILHYYIDHQKLPLRAVFGHSYGARLVLEWFKDKRQSEVKLVVAGRSTQGHISAERLLMMNLYVLKQNYPEVYREYYDKVLSNYNNSVQDLALSVRELIDDPSLKKHFYWANMEAAKSYQEIKKMVPIPENQKIFHSVTKSILLEKVNSADYDIDDYDQDILWLQGLQDVLMAGEQTYQLNKKISIFYGSGHYPHLEEPGRFVDKLTNFLG